jgi:hypothetical protein
MTYSERIEKMKIRTCPGCGERLQDKRQVQCERCARETAEELNRMTGKK